MLLLLILIFIGSVGSNTNNQYFEYKDKDVTIQTAEITKNVFGTNFNDQLCASQMVNFLNALRKSQMWAIQGILNQTTSLIAL